MLAWFHVNVEFAVQSKFHTVDSTPGFNSYLRFLCYRRCDVAHAVADCKSSRKIELSQVQSVYV